MSQIESLPQKPAIVKTFGPGGQVFAANLFGGTILITGSKSMQFFDIAESSPGTYTKVLTNLKEASKIGNSMTFQSVQYGIRFSKIDGTVATAAELAALAAFIAGSRVELFVGSNDTRVFEMDLSHLQNMISGASLDATQSLHPINQTPWFALPEALIQGIEPNTEISGKLLCNLPTGVPALISVTEANVASPKWIFKFLMAGIKQTK